jgi:hypothetical protein
VCTTLGECTSVISICKEQTAKELKSDAEEKFPIWIQHTVWQKKRRDDKETHSSLVMSVVLHGGYKQTQVLVPNYPPHRHVIEKYIAYVLDLMLAQVMYPYMNITKAMVVQGLYRS